MNQPIDFKSGFKLKPNAHVHLMGICGTAMASLAGIFKTMGCKVTGSDQNVYPPMSTQLENLGIKIMEGYKKENLNVKPDLVIVGNVISSHFEEAKALLESNIPYTSLPAALGQFVIDNRHCIVVAGTHGKTTTTSMTSVVADHCDLAPGFMIGGIPANYSQSFRVPSKNTFVIEGDEYDTAFFDKVPKFIHYKPRSVILTSIEFDHADIYKDLDHVKASFKKLLQLIPSDGLLVTHAADKNIKSILSECKSRVVTYGIFDGDYKAVEIDFISGRTHFAVEHHGKKVGDIAIKMFGEHNVLNALAVFALARESKWSLTGALQGLAAFQGVKRRLEVIGEPGGVTILEDFAHHPTAVKTTVASVKKRYPGKKVFAVFEPRSATSRRKVFQKEYGEAFLAADEVLLARPFDQSKIVENDRFSTQELVEDLKNSSVLAKDFATVDEIVAHLKSGAKSGDVILIMSNGAFGGIYQKLLSTLG